MSAENLLLEVVRKCVQFFLCPATKKTARTFTTNSPASYTNHQLTPHFEAAHMRRKSSPHHKERHPTNSQLIAQLKQTTNSHLSSDWAHASAVFAPPQRRPPAHSQINCPAAKQATRSHPQYASSSVLGREAPRPSVTPDFRTTLPKKLCFLLFVFCFHRASRLLSLGKIVTKKIVSLFPSYNNGRRS
ncbi:unnamed protein product, partial [Ectocarpus sp. 12 AP-2014]